MPHTSLTHILILLNTLHIHTIPHIHCTHIWHKPTCHITHVLLIPYHTNLTKENHMPFMHATHTTLQPLRHTAHKIHKHTPYPTYDTQSYTHIEWVPSQSVMEGCVCNEVTVIQTGRHLFYYWAVTKYFSFKFVVYWFLVTSALH